MVTIMSRGLGRLQQAVLSHVKEKGLTTVESVRWIVRDAEEGANLGVGSINAVNRAVDSLSAKSLLKRIERPLQSIEECIAHYPGKTLNAKVRQLRMKLLPALLKPSRSRGQNLRYSLADNEKFHYEGLSEAEQAQHRKNWLSVERDLAAFFGSSDDPRWRAHLFGLYAKGKSIFEADRLEVSRSFQEHLSRCQQILPSELYDRIQHVYTTLLSAERVGNLQMRTFVHTFVNVNNRGSCSLKEEAIEHLVEVSGDYLRSLPGYQESTTKNSRYVFREKDKHDPILNKLFDQTVFQEFNFIEPA